MHPARASSPSPPGAPCNAPPQADYICPHSYIVGDATLRQLLAAYLACLRDAAVLRSRGRGSLGPAASALVLFGIACTAPEEQPLVAMQAAAKAADILADPACHAAVARELAELSQQAGGLELAPQPVLSPRQLQHVLWCQVAEHGSLLVRRHCWPSKLLHTGCGHLREEQVADLVSAVSAAASALPSLDPASPKGLLAAGAALAALRQPTRAAALHTQALQAAQRQEREQWGGYWALRAAAALLSCPTRLMVHVDGGDLHLTGTLMQVRSFDADCFTHMCRCRRALPAHRRAWASRLPCLPWL